MGFDQGRLTFRICRLSEPLPKDAVKRFAADHAQSLDGVMGEPQWGWGTTRHLLDTNITEDSVKLGSYYHICLRQAVRKIPASLLQAECRIQELSKMEAEGRESLNKKERRAIKEEVKEQLLPNMPPQLSGVFVAIDTVEQLLFTTATSQHSLDVFLGMFSKAMGFEPTVLTPDVAASELFHIDAETIPSFCISPDLNAPDGDENGTVGQNFLTWLWYFQEERGGVLPQSKLGEFSLMLDGPMTFVSEGAGAMESVVRKGSPVVSAEAKASLLVGKKLKSARLILARDDQEWSCQVDADEFVFRGLKLPEGEAMDPLSIFEERMTNLYIFQSVFFGLYQKFLGEMSDGKKLADYRKKAKNWVANREGR